ncbi:MAG: carboxylating nicotinate-nucleotide diphosphorylase [Zoogloeaceae bacterium]|jgi:nicotinate-nucleotide pyrophosphorylase (carboxylating)|nr:carboxylating nicotinate-nucleotide diphosphorylase [Zoogloeaceae bacterium]
MSDFAFPDFPVSLEAAVAADVEAALAEDVGMGDLSARLVPPEISARAAVVTREMGILCGQPWFDAVFARLDSDVRVEWRVAEGARVEPGETLCALSGSARALLTGERSALNFLQLLSGVASRARKYADLVSGLGAIIVDTRKTLPGLRAAQKYAVRVGGGGNHRFALWDAILIKENHIHAAGGISLALASAQKIAREEADRCRFVQVEVRNLEEMREALAAGAAMLLLDNFSLSALREAVAENRCRPQPAILEASGGITEETLVAAARAGVDRVSIGALTKNIEALDLSLRFF